MKKEENNAKIHPSDSMDGEIELDEMDPAELSGADLDNTKNDSVDMGNKKTDAAIIKEGEEEDD
jgi:hypothetical protein